MLSRAKTLDGDIIEGSYVNLSKFNKHKMIVQRNISGLNEDGTQKTNNWDKYEYDIDPQSLEYKIGDEWFSMDRLEQMAEYHKGMNTFNIDNGGYVTLKDTK